MAKESAINQETPQALLRISRLVNILILRNRQQHLGI